MAGFMVPGPCEIHCGVGAGGALAFLGWSESGVRVSNRPFFEDVKADISGPLMAGEVQLMGQEAWISLDLKVWNPAVWEAISNRANPRGANAAAPGVYPAGSIGALMLGEGLTFRLLVFRPYAAKAAFAAAGYRAAFNFPAGYLAGPDDIENSTRASKQRTIFRAVQPYNTTTGAFNLYDASAAGKPAAA